MPRSIHPDLLDCMRRPNPYTEIRTEFTVPDVGQTYRRPDQFTGAGRESVSPANSMVVGPNGGLELTPSAIALADFPGTQSSTAFDLNTEDPGRRHKGLSWLVDKNFSRATIRSFTARIGRNAVGALFTNTDFQLEIFRVTRTPGVIQREVNGQITATPRVEYTFRQLLSSPGVIKGSSLVWAANRATLIFDLSAYGLVLENNPDPAPGPDQVGDLPNYYFVITPLNGPGGTGSFFWLQDTGTSPTVANVGTFSKVFWARDHEADAWSANTTAPTGPPSSTITIDSVVATSQAVYTIDLGRAPNVAAQGRFVFERNLPRGTVATAELSTNGGGSWSAIKHGDVIVAFQQTFKIRLTLTSDAPQRATPSVSAFGVEFRIPTDISIESIVEFPTREIATPWLAASIAEARAKVLRLGSRDYEDVATRFGSTQSPPRVEADFYLASRHPSVTRDKWLRLERLSVSNRFPSSLAEDFTLLSYAAKLKRKIPGKVETINTVHTVQPGSDATKLILAPNLPGVAVGDNAAYDSKHYYMRVQKTSGTGPAEGYQQEIQGNTGVNQIDFSPALPSALVTGDTIEIHSGIFNTQSISWQNADPADVWWEILTDHLAIPPERIGQGFLPRGGRPPSLTARAPGDGATQQKLTVTMRLADQESADELLDQLSFIMGGATVEIDGQICFVQVYALRAADGTVTVPLPPVAAVLDIRDYTGLTTPPGLEERATVLTAQYGVNKAAADPNAFPAKSTAIVDNDALQWLTKQDLEDTGTSEMPENISRWLYNTADDGLYLATVVGTQVVRATSTGKRVFTLTPTEPFPHLIPGDPVIILTDAYTDYDPASGTPIKGWLAVRGVATRVANNGRAISLFILGLAENVTLVKGGAEGSLAGLGSADSLFALNDFRVISETETTLTYGWVRGGLVDEVWVGMKVFAIPVPDDPWALVALEAAPLPADTDTFTVNKPAIGFVVFLQVEARTGFLQLGEVRRAVVNAAPPNIVYNQAMAQVIAADATTVTVQVTGGAVEGAPTVQLVGITGSATLLSGPAIGVPSPSGTIWVFTRGPALGGPGEAQFRAIYPGNQSDDDFVTIPEVGRDTVFLAARARVTATTPTTVTVRVAVLDPYPQGANSATINYLDLGSGGVAPAPGGTVTPAATFTEAAGTFIDYVITRPAFGAGAGRVTFTVTAANRVNDSDAVDIPEIDRDTVPLHSRARVTAATPTTITMRVAVADPFPQGAGSATISYQDLGTGGVTPASGGTVTPAATLTEAAGTFIDYTVTRPAFGAGAGRVTFTATASNRVSSSDAIDVPEVGRDTVPLTARTRVISTTPTAVVVRFAVADPFPQGAGSVTSSYQDLGSGGVSPASGGAITPAATLTEAAGTFIDYTITRPAYGSGTARVTFTATATDRVSAQDAVDVPEQASPFVGSTRYRCKLSTSGTPSVANATNTMPNWDSEFYDQGPLHDLVTNPSRITVPGGAGVPLDGFFEIEGQIAWDTNTVGFREIAIWKNRTDLLALVRQPATADQLSHQVIAKDHAPVGGDFYEMRLVQNSGGSRTFVGAGSHFSAMHQW